MDQPGSQPRLDRAMGLRRPRTVYIALVVLIYALGVGLSFWPALWVDFALLLPASVVLPPLLGFLVWALDDALGDSALVVTAGGLLVAGVLALTAWVNSLLWGSLVSAVRRRRTTAAGQDRP